MSPSIPYRSATTTQGRRMAGARALWRATGMRTEDFSRAQDLLHKTALSGSQIKPPALPEVSDMRRRRVGLCRVVGRRRGDESHHRPASLCDDRGHRGCNALFVIHAVNSERLMSENVELAARFYRNMLVSLCTKLRQSNVHLVASRLGV